MTTTTPSVPISVPESRVAPARHAGPAAPVGPAADAAWQAARTFEGMVLGQLLEPMFATVDSASGPFGGGNGEAAWRPMLTDAIARAIADAGGVGLAAPVFQEMSSLQQGKR